MMALALISILALTAAVWLANKIMPFQICPICAGVAGTWLWMLGADFLGYEINLIIPALLMGGSVVGIAYQLEKRLPPPRSALLRKILFIPGGFAAAYGLLTRQEILLLFSAIFLLLVVLIFLLPPKSRAGGQETLTPLEDKMKNCC